MRKNRLWCGATVVAFASLVAAGPAFAATHHRHHGESTPAERAQTKQLNLQQVAMAEGQAPANMQASVAAPNATPEVTTPSSNAPMSTDQSSPRVTPQTPMPDQKPATTPSSGY